MGPGLRRGDGYAALARLSSAIDVVSSVSVAPLITSSSCATLVALAIGAVMPGRAISQAIATAAGVERWRAATLSTAARMPSPRASRYFFMPPPRGLLPRSASERYLPVRKPAASDQ